MIQANFTEIASIIFSAVLILFAVLGYVTTIRKFINGNYGKYRLGFVDGAVLTLILMAITFYLVSLITL